MVHSFHTAVSCPSHEVRAQHRRGSLTLSRINQTNRTLRSFGHQPQTLGYSTDRTACSELAASLISILYSVMEKGLTYFVAQDLVQVNLPNLKTSFPEQYLNPYCRGVLMASNSTLSHLRNNLPCFCPYTSDKRALKHDRGSCDQYDRSDDCPTSGLSIGH